MSGVAIGKRLNHGYIGQPSRTDDTIIESRTADGAISFGAPVKITSDNKVKAIGTGDAATAFFWICNERSYAEFRLFNWSISLSR